MTYSDKVHIKKGAPTSERGTTPISGLRQPKLTEKNKITGSDSDSQAYLAILVNRVL